VGPGLGTEVGVLLGNEFGYVDGIVERFDDGCDGGLLLDCDNGYAVGLFEGKRVLDVAVGCSVC
jgi:hypothetical protein